MEPTILLNNLENFEGAQKQSFENYIRRFNEITDILELSPEIKLVLLKLKLRKEAQKILESSDNLQNEKDYTKFCKELQEKFSPKQEFFQLQKIFTTTVQNKDQTVNEFLEILQKNAKRFLIASELENSQGAQELTNKMIFSLFINGLLPQLKFEVEKIYPDTLEEAKKVALKAEKAWKNFKQAEDKNDSQTELLACLLKQNLETQNQLKEVKHQLNNLTFKTQQRDREVQFCKICRKRNHATTHCWYNQNKSYHNFGYGYQPRPRRSQYTGASESYNPHYNNYNQYSGNTQTRYPAITQENVEQNYEMEYLPQRENYYRDENIFQNSQPIITEVEMEHKNKHKNYGRKDNRTGQKERYSDEQAFIKSDSAFETYKNSSQNDKIPEKHKNSRAKFTTNNYNDQDKSKIENNHKRRQNYQNVKQINTLEEIVEPDHYIMEGNQTENWEQNSTDLEDFENSLSTSRDADEQSSTGKNDKIKTQRKSKSNRAIDKRNKKNRYPFKEKYYSSNEILRENDIYM